MIQEFEGEFDAIELTDRTEQQAGGTEPDLPRVVNPAGYPAGSRQAASENGASWQNIEISFLSDERVQIRNGANIETRNYGEFGFADRRAKQGARKHKQAWATLRAMAVQNGIVQDGAKMGADWSKVEKRIQEIRRVLRRRFGIAADPVPFIAGTGYRARFKISCGPSFDA